VAPPAAIANAVRDALAAVGGPNGVELNETPITPQRVLAGDPKNSPISRLVDQAP